MIGNRPHSSVTRSVAGGIDPGIPASTPPATGARALRRRAAFTLIEMAVVIGIIVLLIGIAIPAVRALDGDRNIGAAYNQLSAIMGQARQDALALQTIHGVVFYLDPKDDRIYAMYVQSVTAPTTLPTGMSTNTGTLGSPQVWLDAVPNREQIALSNGVGLETIANPSPSYNPPQQDRYLGFNPSQGPCKFGGAILFDANGQLASQTYVLLCNSVFGGGTLATSQISGGPPVPNSTSGSTGNSAFVYSQSQFGFVLFDRDAFLNQSFTDGDDGLDPSVSSYGALGTAGSEAAEEQWLDQNSTPVLVNRYNGTLIKSE